MSLFLLLLVFFIVLFSVAQVHKERAVAVIASIDHAFGGLPSKLGLLGRPQAAPPDQADAEAFVQSVSALLTGFAPLKLDAAAGQGGLLEIDMSAAQVFVADSTTLRTDLGATLDRLAVILQRRVPDQRYRLTVRTVIPATEAAGGPAETLAAARGAAFAEALFAQGCPTDALAIGLERGPKAAIRLEFSLVRTAVDAE